mmetsp:Transcript_18668/g.70927  ORF Transcript_18668/g.70927 Transcript_18668/m.70927 type:complete len:219 (+) Transcript_18668:914-1570(+)
MPRWSGVAAAPDAERPSSRAPAAALDVASASVGIVLEAAVPLDHATLPGDPGAAAEPMPIGGGTPTSVSMRGPGGRPLPADSTPPAALRPKVSSLLKRSCDLSEPRTSMEPESSSMSASRPELACDAARRASSASMVSSSAVTSARADPGMGFVCRKLCEPAGSRWGSGLWRAGPTEPPASASWPCVWGPAAAGGGQAASSRSPADAMGGATSLSIAT